MSNGADSETSRLGAFRAALARADEALGEALSELAAVTSSGAGAVVSEREWRRMLTETERVERRASAARLRVIAGAEGAGAPEAMGFVDTGSWVSKHTGSNRPSAAIDAVIAVALGDGAAQGGQAQGGGAGQLTVVGSEGAGSDRSGPLGTGNTPRTPAGVALDAGDISAEHARVIVQALGQLPDGVDLPGREACERELVRLAKNRTPAQLRKAARRVLAVIEADAAAVDAHEEAVVADLETAARERTAFWIKDNRDGTMTGQFTVPWYSGAALKKVVDAMTAPRRSTRLAALAENGAGQAGASSAAGVAGGSDNGSATSIGSDSDVAAVSGSWQMDHLSWQQKRGLAFADLLTRIPTDHLHPKTAATVLVTVDLDTLTGDLARVAGTDVGDDLSAGQVRRLACEAGIVPAVLGGASVPLDLGRQRRLHSEAQRVALALLYDECAAEGCDRPFAWTEMHHLHAWRDGGHTRVDETVPLCGTHHHLIDRNDTDHRVDRLDDGRVAITFWRRRVVG